MSAALHLARPQDLERLLPLVATFHAETGVESSDSHRRGAILPLLEGHPYGAYYLIGPVRAPIGYVAVTFTWSMERGGLDGRIEQLFVRPAVRGRGIATEVLFALPRSLAEAGINRLHMDVPRSNPVAHRLCERARFDACEDLLPMRRAL